MRGLTKLAATSGIILFAIAGAFARPASPVDDRNSIVIVFKDGHRQSFAMTELARIDFQAGTAVFKDGHHEKLAASEIENIEFETPAQNVSTPSRAHFIGKWLVGDGSGHDFYITLDADGDAKKTRGAAHGTWSMVDGEARIAWDDGWHDAIRKVGTSHEKFAYEPGKSFDDKPSNVTEARSTLAKPI
jgi:hypothetical protein